MGRAIRALADHPFRVLDGQVLRLAQAWTSTFRLLECARLISISANVDGYGEQNSERLSEKDVLLPMLKKRKVSSPLYTRSSWWPWCVEEALLHSTSFAGRFCFEGRMFRMFGGLVAFRYRERERWRQKT